MQSVVWNGFGRCFCCKKLLFASVSAGLSEFWSRKGSRKVGPRVSRHVSLLVFASRGFVCAVKYSCCRCTVLFGVISGVFFGAQIICWSQVFQAVCKSFGRVRVREHFGPVCHIVASSCLQKVDFVCAITYSVFLPAQHVVRNY